MKHARRDYDRFQDPWNKIPDDEPVMLFRAQDKHAADVLREYARLVRNDVWALPEGAEREAGLAVADATDRHAALMDAWPKKKRPDLAP